ncbi:MAG: hypothetical protein CEE41_04310 [Hadesarchaea archaeon B3_Hades]|nr:MAG: hypothetical protein CEE41_04310 [Hadesarchaea archaeon B3_Hades]
MTTTKRIRVSIETHQSLQALGRKGETFDSIIRSLIEDSRLYREVLGETPIGELPDIEEEVKE